MFDQIIRSLEETSASFAEGMTGKIIDSNVRITQIMPQEIMKGVSEEFRTGGLQYILLEEKIRTRAPEAIDISDERAKNKHDRLFIQVLENFIQSHLDAVEGANLQQFKSASDLGIDLSELGIETKEYSSGKSLVDDFLRAMGQTREDFETKGIDPSEFVNTMLNVANNLVDPNATPGRLCELKGNAIYMTKA